MKPLFTQQEFEIAKGKEKLPCQCYECNKKFYAQKSNIKYELKNKRGRVKYCSQECNNLANNPVLSCEVLCKNCSNKFEKSLNQCKKFPNHFCSKSCAATYNNKHKTKGTRRSKLEKYIEEQLTLLYPDLKIDFNKKDIIGSELDIYIPSLNIAFELNGIFHYEPIYGQDKLNKIQNNDTRKFQACLEKNIEFVIIDSSGLKYFKIKNADKYLNIIIEIINKKLDLICCERGIRIPAFRV
jgi:hypothetical protein